MPLYSVMCWLAVNIQTHKRQASSLAGTARAVGRVLGEEAPLDRQEPVLSQPSITAALPVGAMLGIAVALS